MIHYRTFRNNDPPGLAEVWNESFSGRGAVRLQVVAWLEYFLFAKTYFDPHGLIIACEDHRIVGFALGAFGPNDTENALDPRAGVVCLLAVLPSHRNRGIGSELLRRAETFLREQGSEELFAGPMSPLNPYTLGLYGGSGSPGFLDSDTAARAFLEHRGYTVEKSCQVFQRRIQQALNISDGRFAAHRLRYEVHASPFQGTTWWQECVLGPIELHEYRLRDKLTGRTAARALMWEMETYTSRWGEHAIGISDLAVPDELRRQGLAKFLLAQILRYLQDQFFTVVEIQAQAESSAAINLLLGLGFQHIDTGHIYRKSSHEK